MARTAPLSIESVMKGIKASKARWIDSVLKKHLPGEVYRKVHSTDARDRIDGLRWCEERGYRIVEDKDTVSVKKGTREIARTRMVLDLEKPEDLIALAKTAQIKQGGGL